MKSGTQLQADVNGQISLNLVAASRQILKASCKILSKIEGRWLISLEHATADAVRRPTQSPNNTILG